MENIGYESNSKSDTKTNDHNFVLTKSDEILESLKSLHNLHEYFSELSNLNSKYLNDYNNIYKKYWGQGRDGQNMNSISTTKYQGKNDATA